MTWRVSSEYLGVLLLAAGVAGASVPGLAQTGTSWRRCAVENGYCKVPRPANVRYGIGERWIYQTVRDGIECSNQAFGYDPARGYQKICEMQVTTPPSTIPPELYPASPSI